MEKGFLEAKVGKYLTVIYWQHIKHIKAVGDASPPPHNIIITTRMHHEQIALLPFMLINCCLQCSQTNIQPIRD
jgi:hypothetical protein